MSTNWPFKTSDEILSKLRDNKPFLNEEVVKFALRQRNMSRAELAKAAGYSRSSVISSLFNGKTKPTRKRVTKMAAALGCEPNELLVRPEKVPAYKQQNYASHAINARQTWATFNERNRFKQEDAYIDFLVRLRAEIDSELRGVEGGRNESFE